jgi:AcrR family transcriptional regulator
VEGAKRDEIIDAATRRFGRDGYENTRWADIASDVGVSPTGLYYYFESKQHCLFVILGQAMADIQARFERLAGGDPHPPPLCTPPSLRAAARTTWPRWSPCCRTVSGSPSMTFSATGSWWPSRAC